MNKQISGKLDQLKERLGSGDFINESKTVQLGGGICVIKSLNNNKNQIILRLSLYLFRGDEYGRNY